MKIVNRLARPFFVKWLVFFMGLLIMSFGISLMIKANLGSAPWDVLHIGLYYQFGLSIGTWSIIIGFLIIGATSWLTKKWPQAGAFLNMLFVGIFIDGYLMLPFFKTPDSTAAAIIMLAAGLIINGFGIGLYIASDCGAGPRDSLMLALTEKTGKKVAHIRLFMELFVLAGGWLLKGPVSLGTILFCVSIGSIVGYTLSFCKKIVNYWIERSVYDEDLNKRTIWLDHHDGLGKKVR
ncbi:YitT family protein [Fictibacillus sp. B-59209]|uniref:YczE/YyaS/YitT family protein n=1 Tax=Fictibacillus sp. B-59209 TaxID=3024873 RepID=UPI002E2197DA|nr:YitT family protein [Fictibacillus sp. B-59209]